MAKPTSKPNWTVGNASFATLTVEPSAGKKLAGWGAGERPAHQFMNWLFYIINEWITYFDEQIDLVAAAGTQYDAVVGAGGSHTTLADLMADPDIATIKNVLVVSPLTITAPIVVNQNDMRIDFKPQAFIAKGPGANIGMQITAERVKLSNCRFMNFDTVGDKAIQLTAPSKYCIVEKCYFLDCDTSIDDLGTSNASALNIEEV